MAAATPSAAIVVIYGIPVWPPAQVGDTYAFAAIVLTLILAAGTAATYFLTPRWKARQQRRSPSRPLLRLVARPNTTVLNLPNPGPGLLSLRTTVMWEMWVESDVHTSEVGLTFVLDKQRKWWEFWRPRQWREKSVGMYPNGQDTYTYRRTLRATDPQPVVDHAEFSYIGPYVAVDRGEARLELTLKTGSPVGTFSTDVVSTVDERGSGRPL
jgi:hypothetical protein